MKIAIVAQSEKRHVVGKLGGGIMAVERMHAELLASVDRVSEVHLLLTKDSEDIFPGHAKIRVHKVGVPCEESFGETEYTKHQRGALNRERTDHLEATIREIQPSLIINHSFSSSQLRMCTRLADEIPVLTFLHCLHESASDMSLFSKLEKYAEITDKGSELVCVSTYQRDRWRDRMTDRLLSGSEHFKMLRDPEFVKKIFTRVCGAGLANSSMPVNDPEGYLVIIGRPEADKNIGKALEGFAKLKRPEKLKIFMAYGGNVEDYEYYNEKMKPWLTDKVEILSNRPRSEMLDVLSRADALISAAPLESFGIAPLEAACCGVGTILFCGEDKSGKLHHAGFDVLGGAPDTYLTVNVKRDQFLPSLEQTLNSLSKLTSNRKTIRANALARHSADVRSTELMTAIDEVISRYAERTSFRAAKTKLLAF